MVVCIDFFYIDLLKTRQVGGKRDRKKGDEGGGKKEKKKEREREREMEKKGFLS